MKNLLKFLLFVLLVSAAISGLYDYRLKHGGLKFLAQTTSDKYTLSTTASVDLSSADSIHVGRPVIDSWVPGFR